MPPISAVLLLTAAVTAAVLATLAALVSRHVHNVNDTEMGRMLQVIPVRYALGFSALLAPFTEELFFRGVLVPAFGRRYITTGVVASAAIFTAAHADQLRGAAIALVPIACVGITNAVLRARSGGITQPWIVHTIYNAALSVSLYFG